MNLTASPHEGGPGIEAISRDEAIRMCPYLGGLAVEEANAKMEEHELNQRILAAEAEFGIEAALEMADRYEDARDAGESVTLEMFFGSSKDSTSDESPEVPPDSFLIIVAAEHSKTEPAKRVLDNDLLSRINNRESADDNLSILSVNDTREATESFAIRDVIHKKEKSEAATPARTITKPSTIKAAPAANPAQPKPRAVSSIAIKPVQERIDAMKQPILKAAPQKNRTEKPRITFKPVDVVPTVLVKVPAPEVPIAQLMQFDGTKKSAIAPIFKKQESVESTQVVAAKATQKEVTPKREEATPIEALVGGAEVTVAVENDLNHYDSSTPTHNEELQTELEEVFEPILQTTADGVIDSPAQTIEATELFEDARDAMDGLPEAKVPKVEELLDEVVAILMKPKNLDQLVSELASPQTSEEKLNGVFIELFETMEINVSKAQVKQVVRLLIQRKQEFNMLMEQTSQSTKDRGTHEVISRLGLSISDLKQLLEPLHALLGRIVLSSARY